MGLRAIAVPGFDRAVHTETGALLADIVDETLRLHGRLLGMRKPAGLRSSAQGIVLTSIVLASEPPTVARIARSLGYSRQAIQRLSNALAEAGHVEYVENPHHKTSQLLLPTAKGRATYAQMNRDSAQWTARISSGLGRDALLAARDALRQVRQNIEHDRCSLNIGTKKNRSRA